MNDASVFLRLKAEDLKGAGTYDPYLIDFQSMVHPSTSMHICDSSQLMRVLQTFALCCLFCELRTLRCRSPRRWVARWFRWHMTPTALRLPARCRGFRSSRDFRKCCYHNLCKNDLHIIESHLFCRFPGSFDTSSIVTRGKELGSVTARFRA